MNTAVMFSSAKDDWRTPPSVLGPLIREFHFDLDAAAVKRTRRCESYFGPDHVYAEYRDGLTADWDACTVTKCVWLNPPYSRGLQAKFIAKAASERMNGITTVMLIPARTDTKAFHRYIWDAERHRPRPGVEVRFLPGRIKFVGATHGAPFPSMIVIFRGA